MTGDRVSEYDPATDTWTSRAPLPTPRHGLAVVALDGRLHALGGSGPTGAHEVYDPATDTWSRAAPMPTPRVFLAAAVLGGEIYALGGSPDCCGDSRTAVVEVYDPATDTWSAAAPLPVALQSSAAVALGGEIHVFGGFVPGEGVVDTTFVYDPATDSWSTSAPLPTPRDQAPAVRVGDEALVLGGSTDCHCSALDDNERFEPAREPTADLEVGKDNGVDRLTDGQRVRYTVTVRNRGPDPVAGVLVEDPIPEGLTSASWTCDPSPGAACSPGGDGSIADLVALPVGGVATYVLAATVDAGGGAVARVVNTATATLPANVVDPVPGDNSATDDDPVRLPPETLPIPLLSPLNLLLLVLSLLGSGLFLLRRA